MIRPIADRKTRTSFIKYLITGGSAFAVEYLLFLLLRTVMHFIAANIMVYTFMFWTVFTAHKFISFKNRSNVRGGLRRQIVRYTALYFINLVVMNSLLYGLNEYLMVDPAIGKFFVSGLACLWNFALYKLVVYRE